MSDLHDSPARAHDAGALIVLRGEIDGANADDVGEQIADAGRRPGSMVLVDMADVTFMDSQGLRMLLVARQALAAEGGLLQLVRPPKCVRLVLDLSGVTELFSIDEG